MAHVPFAYMESGELLQLTTRADPDVLVSFLESSHVGHLHLSLRALSAVWLLLPTNV